VQQEELAAQDLLEWLVRLDFKDFLAILEPQVYRDWGD